MKEMKKIEILIQPEIWDQLKEIFPELNDMENNKSALRGRVSAIINEILIAEL
ncbi:MAG: hypothetical protein GF311_04835 [Candidatus Lokiarchaeota archaeon]|nr:hypothetical protein [Candidatus Lokiarchaeota archaeon]